MISASASDRAGEGERVAENTGRLTARRDRDSSCDAIHNSDIRSSGSANPKLQGVVFREVACYPAAGSGYLLA
jgi:hypothetical protein